MRSLPETLVAEKKPVIFSSDYDTANTVEERKFLKTYGLTPPGVDTFEKQEQRCKDDPLWHWARRKEKSWLG